MRSLAVLFCPILGLAASLSLPVNPPIVQFLSLPNESLSAHSLPNSTFNPLDRWPNSPFRSLITEKVTEGVIEKTYMVIDRYQPASPNPLKGAVMGNITLIEKLIDGWGKPDYYIDNRRMFTEGLVSVRFPTGQITNWLAAELLGAAWGLEYAFGPRGWEFATIETVRDRGEHNVVGFFSLWIASDASSHRLSA